ncbi:SIMPL domain-containing protein [Gillisia sp. CAL575]|uniref:SIMPL domain-containing protein n=1 Tax=Gillisia sp. CAL575 TaxID=985255 RepID=UPI00039F9B8E|nr:SIMPL domain-containing protein [Gillisia sp. CAL575]
MKSILILFAALGTFAVQAQQINNITPAVSVNGEGIIKVIPDEVVIKSRIEHDGENAQEVKKQNDAVVDAVIKYLKSEGVPEKNIQTDYVNLNKNYNYNDKTYSYVANQAISIKLDNLKNYEKIMSGLLNVGLNRIDGVQFKSSEMEKYMTEARKKAVLNAKSKASEYASPLNQSIGKAISISEVQTNNFPPMYRMNEMKMSSDSGEQQETLAPGEMEISAQVTVAFELK